MQRLGIRSPGKVEAGPSAADNAVAAGPASATEPCVRARSWEGRFEKLSDMPYQQLAELARDLSSYKELFERLSESGLVSEGLTYGAVYKEVVSRRRLILKPGSGLVESNARRTTALTKLIPTEYLEELRLRSYEDVRIMIERITDAADRAIEIDARIAKTPGYTAADEKERSAILIGVAGMLHVLAQRYGYIGQSETSRRLEQHCDEITKSANEPRRQGMAMDLDDLAKSVAAQHRPLVPQGTDPQTAKAVETIQRLVADAAAMRPKVAYGIVGAGDLAEQLDKIRKGMEYVSDKYYHPGKQDLKQPTQNLAAANYWQAMADEAQRLSKAIGAAPADFAGAVRR